MYHPLGVPPERLPFSEAALSTKYSNGNSPSMNGKLT